MKKKMMASVLSLTAGFAAQFHAPSIAQARSIRYEKAFPDVFRLQAATKARYTTSEGRVLEGRIILMFDQSTKLRPDFPNQVDPEMQGDFYFEANEATENDGVGGKYKVRADLAGDDGAVILDRIHRGEGRRTSYQVYGCNSTLTSCSAERFEVTFDGASVELKAEFGPDLGVELLDQDGQWVKTIESMPLVPAKDD